MPRRIPGAGRQRIPPRHWDDPESMLGVGDARSRVLAAFQRLEPIRLPLLDTLGHILAEDVVAQQNVPPFRNSAMDGYAVRSSDLSSASATEPVRLRVIGELPAGYPPKQTVQPGHAVRLMTGAVLPDGADAVVRFELTDELDSSESAGTSGAKRGEHVHVFAAARPMENVREAGEDIKSGAVALAQGSVIRAGEIGVLASLNRSTVLVYRRPRVAILSTGDEVVDLGPDLQPGQIRNSNSYTLAALVRQFGGDPILLGVAQDQVDDINHRLQQARGADLLLTSGGVSVGDYDMVKEVLQAGGVIELWQVRIKPGKPLAFGCIGDVPLLGLPGNPVAALVAFLQFARPALLKMRGFENLAMPRVKATLLDDHENRGRRRHFVRGVLEMRDGIWVVRPSGGHGSGILSSVTRSNCFIVLPEDLDRAEAGMIVDVELIDLDIFAGILP